MSDSEPEPLIDPDDSALDHDDNYNVDPGAAPSDAGIPGIADDATPGSGEVPEPQRAAMPTDAPIESTTNGAAVRNEADEASLDERLAEEEPDLGPGEREQPEVGNGMHVEEEPPLLDDQPHQP